MQRLFWAFSVSRRRNAPSFKLTRSDITCGYLGMGGGVRPTSSCSFCKRREHYGCVAVILAQDSAVNHKNIDGAAGKFSAPRSVTFKFKDIQTSSVSTWHKAVKITTQTLYAVSRGAFGSVCRGCFWRRSSLQTLIQVVFLFNILSWTFCACVNSHSSSWTSFTWFGNIKALIW